MYKIYPIPQFVDYGVGREFVLATPVNMVAGAGIDMNTVRFLREVLEKYHVSYEESETQKIGKTNICLKCLGDASASEMELFAHPDAYVLRANKNCITIYGKNSNSVYHGIATLKMMFSSFEGKKFLDVEIKDYACIAQRGFIEGFYGAWDFKKREDLMRFVRDYKMNSFVYAAKGDKYHTDKWDELYPEDMVRGFERLVRVGEETKVRFGWALHLGAFFAELDLSDRTAYERRFGQLVIKVNQMYDVGVRDFSFLNDDFGHGSHGTVVAVINRLNRYLKEKGCSPLVYCPQGYSEKWAKVDELEAMRKLEEDVRIYWTGDDVNAPLTQSTVDFIQSQTNHQANHWLNYPVNEHAPSGIFLGDITHYARDGVKRLGYFHANPSRFAYASEVGLYQVAALVWNNTNYLEHAEEIWRSAFHYLQPEVERSYFKIASNVSNAPNSWKVEGYRESEYLKEQLRHVQESLETTAVFQGEFLREDTEVQELLLEFQNIQDAVVDFREHCENQDLVQELQPWLNSLMDVLNAAKNGMESVISLSNNQKDLAVDKLNLAKAFYRTRDTYPTDIALENTYARAGSRRLEPFARAVIEIAEREVRAYPCDRS